MSPESEADEGAAGSFQQRKGPRAPIPAEMDSDPDPTNQAPAVRALKCTPAQLSGSRGPLGKQEVVFFSKNEDKAL